MYVSYRTNALPASGESPGLAHWASTRCIQRDPSTSSRDVCMYVDYIRLKIALFYLSVQYTITLLVYVCSQVLVPLCKLWVLKHPEKVSSWGYWTMLCGTPFGIPDWEVIDACFKPCEVWLHCSTSSQGQFYSQIVQGGGWFQPPVCVVAFTFWTHRQKNIVCGHGRTDSKKTLFFLGGKIYHPGTQ